MAAILNDEQFITGELKPVTKKGKPANVEAGSVDITSSDENIFTVERDPDNELKFKVLAKNAGVAQLDFSADADLGEGVKTISGFAAVEVVPAGATGFGISFGEPQEQPEAPAEETPGEETPEEIPSTNGVSDEGGE